MGSTNLADLSRKIDTVRLITSSQCQTITSSVTSLNHLFIDRNIGFSTLGVSSYLDINHPVSSRYWGSSPGSIESYLASAKTLNPTLDNFFISLYNLVCRFFSSRFQVECILHPTCARPGFHHYNNHPSNSRQISHIPHFDGQYEQLLPMFSGSLTPYECIHNTLSFTLPICLPACGSGLKYWEFHYEDTLNISRDTCIGRLSSIKPRELIYEVGDLVYHSGHLLHQIKAWPARSSDSPRITLQGHGLLFNNILYLYW